MTLASYLNSQFTLIQYGEFFLRILISIICGALIGIERSRRFKDAGIRTHIIVCVASCLVMIVSKYGFADVFQGTDGADPARLAAQVISGISFLGAGVIFHTSNSIKGLTTAAGIWATACIGLAIGTGMYVLGIFVTLVIFLVQLLMHNFEIGGDAYFTTKIHFCIKDDAELRRQVKVFMDDRKCQVMENKIKFEEEGFISYNMTVRTNKEITIDELMSFLESKGEVKSVSCVTMN